MNPYSTLPDRAFWKKTVAEKSIFDISNLWSPKFKITKDSRVVTFGSCFAQHIGNALDSRGFNWVSTEIPPKGLSQENGKKIQLQYFFGKNREYIHNLIVEAVGRVGNREKRAARGGLGKGWTVL